MWKGTLIRGNDPDTKAPMIVAVEEASKTLRINNWVWNTVTVAWERMKQPVLELTGDLTVSMGDVEKLLAEGYWKDQRLEYSGSNLIYKGLNTVHKAATDATTWYIWKFTWAGKNCTRIEGPLVGSWDGNSGLAWS